ncbi:GntR family transcriptional regulator [Streptomyces syringium]|uniref:GntR family transcriptional regulator n=1 Tax=Streptomyces syringium TaxID=76729 RepID=UPI0037D84170
MKGPNEPAQTALYHLYDADDRLLYVGITNDTTKRLAAHRHSKHWWRLVAREAVEWFATREEAEKAEIDAIRRNHPRYNRAHNMQGEISAEFWAELREKKRLFPRGHADYGTLADFLRRKIDDGAWMPGETLPRHSSMESGFMVSPATLRRALMILEQRGVIDNRNGSGRYVVNAPEDRLLYVPVGRPEKAADILRQRLSPEDLTTLISRLCN